MALYSTYTLHKIMSLHAKEVIQHPKDRERGNPFLDKDLFSQQKTMEEVSYLDIKPGSVSFIPDPNHHQLIDPTISTLNKQFTDHFQKPDLPKEAIATIFGISLIDEAAEFR